MLNEKNHRKRKILIFGATPPPVGGIATFISLLLKSDLFKQYELIAFDPSKQAPKGKTLFSKVVFKGISLFKFALILIAKRPELVHFHSSAHTGFWINSAFMTCAAIFRTKLVLHIHRGDFNHFYQESNLICKYLIRYVLGLCNKIIILTELCKPFFCSLVPEDKIEISPNCIPVDDYWHKEDFPQNYRQLASKRTILFIGSLAEAKGIYDLIKAIPRIRRRHPHANFVFAGSSDSSEERERLLKLCQDGIRNAYILLPGIINGIQKIEFLNAADLLVLPSYSEGFPFVILEAMAAGLPVVATSVGAIPEVVIDGKNGYIVRPGDHVAMAEKICMLLENAPLCKEMGHANRIKVKECYDINMLAEKLDNLYRHLL